MNRVRRPTVFYGDPNFELRDSSPSAANQPSRFHLERRVSWSRLPVASYHFITEMPFPTKVCAVCSQEFELKPDKPGFANRCPECSTAEPSNTTSKSRMDADERKSLKEANAARREAMRNLLYRKDS